MEASEKGREKQEVEKGWIQLQRTLLGIQECGGLS